MTAAMRQAGTGLKAAWRAQITGAGLGQRLANSIRLASFPKSGESLDAAALVWSKAPVIVGAHDTGPLIRSKNGVWLAIPTAAAGTRLQHSLPSESTGERLDQRVIWFVRLDGPFRQPHFFPPTTLNDTERDANRYCFGVQLRLGHVASPTSACISRASPASPSIRNRRFRLSVPMSTRSTSRVTMRACSAGISPIAPLQQSRASPCDAASAERPVRGAIEFKHQNISAVLQGLGEDWIPGYKPDFNFQMTLVDAVARWLALNPACVILTISMDTTNPLFNVHWIQRKVEIERIRANWRSIPSRSAAVQTSIRGPSFCLKRRSAAILAPWSPPRRTATR